MTPIELNYDIYNKKLLTIVVVFQTWKIYTEESTEIIIFIDHKNLTIFYIMKELNRK